MCRDNGGLGLQRWHDVIDGRKERDYLGVSDRRGEGEGGN